jgi:hypothetical protein
MRLIKRRHVARQVTLQEAAGVGADQLHCIEVVEINATSRGAIDARHARHAREGAFDAERIADFEAALFEKLFPVRVHVDSYALLMHKPMIFTVGVGSVEAAFRDLVANDESNNCVESLLLA